MKFALLSHVMPPSWSGQAVVLGRLLDGLDPSEYCLISPYPKPSAHETFMRPLEANYYHLPHEEIVNRGYRFGLNYVREAINFVYGVFKRTRQLAKIIEREKCEAIVACSGHLHDMPAARLASRLKGIRFYAYYFDYYSHQFTLPETRALAKLAERWFIHRTDGIITTNAVTRDHLQQRYGVDAMVLHFPFDLAGYQQRQAGCSQVQQGPKNEVRIVYTGAVYHAHFDAFHNLIRAIEMLGRSEIKLHIYTAQPTATLATEGIASRSIVFHDHRHTYEVPCVQRTADVLFLPLAFNSPYPMLVQTAAPVKLPEYLASGRPILCHAPHGSFISSYLRDHDCGLVVDQSDPERLAAALDQLLRDTTLQSKITTNALQRARADFDQGLARARFARILRGQAEMATGLQARIDQYD